MEHLREREHDSVSKFITEEITCWKYVCTVISGSLLASSSLDTAQKSFGV